MSKLAFATCRSFPDLAEDDRLVLPLLARKGHTVAPLVWDDPAQDRAAFDAVVLRSCWDVHRAPVAFDAWLAGLEQKEIRVLNPARVARWSLQKTYLRDLAARGAVVPRTAWVDPGSPATLAQLLREHGFEQAVVKPVVSLGGHDTWRTSPARAADDEPAFRALARTRGMMVQEYLAAIEDQGELSFLFFDGRFSHAVRKRPAPGEFRVQEEHGGLHAAFSPDAGLVARAEAILATVGEPLAFARVDVVETRGELFLMELEAIDPSLFLAYDAGAPARFAGALDRWVTAP